jgi:hypothetical protein
VECLDSRAGVTPAWDCYSSTNPAVCLDFGETVAMRSHSGATGRVAADLGRTVPALPVRDIQAAVRRYRERFGFEVPHQEDAFAVLRRDAA